MFLHLSVILLKGGSLFRGVSFQGVSVQGVSVHGGLCPRGLCHGDAWYGGTHPTGMHYCYICSHTNICKMKYRTLRYLCNVKDEQQLCICHKLNIQDCSLMCKENTKRNIGSA